MYISSYNISENDTIDNYGNDSDNKNSYNNDNTILLLTIMLNKIKSNNNKAINATPTSHTADNNEYNRTTPGTHVNGQDVKQHEK